MLTHTALNLHPATTQMSYSPDSFKGVIHKGGSLIGESGRVFTAIPGVETMAQMLQDPCAASSDGHP